MKTFAELEYIRPDMQAVKGTLEDINAMLKRAKNADDCMEAILAMEKAQAEVQTAYSLAHIRNTMDTSDPFWEGEMAFFDTEMPKLIPLQKQYRQALLESPHRAALQERCGAQMFRQAEARQRTSSPKIMDLLVKEATLRGRYSKAAAGCKVEFRGENCNFYGLLKHMQSTDRQIRKEAYLAWAKLYEEVSPTLDDIYDQLLDARIQMSQKLGFDEFASLGYLNRGRLDYGPAQVAEFRKQVLEVIVPACDRLRRAQAKRLGVDKLKFYDESLLFPTGNPTPRGTMEEMVTWANEMYHEMSPETGEFFDFMVQHRLFDLQTRPGKRLGGYCTSLPAYKAPFIFSNFNGTSADVDVLTHEAGHAFQGYLCTREQLLSDNCHSTSEINEIHSMAMEHFAYPWMDKFFGDDAPRYRHAHLLGALEVLPYMMCVDEFQHEVYANPTMTAMERRAVWHRLEQTYMPWRDYDGVEFLEAGGFWMQKQHIFLYPFYYIDYALAQICAFELYGRMKEDRDAAWQDYLRLCRAGGSKGYFDLLQVANLSNPFEAGSVQRAVQGVLAELEALEGDL